MAIRTSVDVNDISNDRGFATHSFRQDILGQAMTPTMWHGATVAATSIDSTQAAQASAPQAAQAPAPQAAQAPAPQAAQGPVPQAAGWHDLGADNLVSAIAPLAPPGAFTINGNASAQSIIGTSAADVINGGGGADTVSANEGNDYVQVGAQGSTVYGWTGSDTLIGGAGNDQLAGDDGNDWIFTNGGANTVFGWTGADYIVGGDSNDQISGDQDNDTIFGGLGNDTLIGSDGNDYVEGNAGNDTMYGGEGIDDMHGSAGNDSMGGDNGIDFIFGGTGDDTIFGGTGDDHIAGGDGNDIIGGDADNDEIYGDAGDDQIFGGAGNDTLIGGLGADTLNGEAGNDLVIFGQGADTLYTGDGNDVLRLAAGSDLSQFRGTIGDFTIGTDKDHIDLSQVGITGIGSGAHEITLSNNSVLYHGVDILDVVTSSGLGLTASDFIFADGGTTTPGSPTAGDDNITGTTGPDTIDALAGNDTVDGLGGNDSLIGGAGNDVLSGGDGNDTIGGGEGADSLAGGAGNDFINAGSENDLIFFSAGNDSLAGGTGADIFRFAAPENLTEYHGTLSDFTFGTDKIDVSAMGITGLGTGAHQLNVTASGVFSNGVKVFDVAAIQNLTASDFIFAGSSPTVPGGATDGNDTITGTANADTINALAGNDSVTGLGGNDSLIGGLGNDTLDGGDGNDTLLGTRDVGSDQDAPYHDVLNGGNGNDSITHFTESTISGGAGDDVITVGWIFGLPEGHNGEKNLIDGGDGNDTIISGANSTVIGGLGSDRIYVDGGSQVSAGSGDDVLTASGSSRFPSSLGSVVLGGDGSDSILLAPVATAYTTAIRVDTIDGGAGNDTIDGGLGNDVLTGGTGSDLFIFNMNEYNNYFFFTGSTREGSAGPNFDSVITDYQVGGTDHIQIGDVYYKIATSNPNEFTIGSRAVTAQDITNMLEHATTTTVGGVPSTVLHLPGDFHDMTVTLAGVNVGQLSLTDFGFTPSGPTAGNDTLTGTSTTDYFDLRAGGNDVLSASGGDDHVFMGGALNAADRIDGGTGNDEVLLQGDYATSGHTITLGAATLTGVEQLTLLSGGDDSYGDPLGHQYSYNIVTNEANVAAGATLAIDASGLQSQESVTFNGQAETNGNFRFTGGAGADRFTGSLGNDSVNGGAGNDWLAGNPGNDTLIGGTGNDSLYGGDGVDSLDGGTGNDEMYGDLGNDTMSGGAGNDFMFGFDGDDVMNGGDGDDIVRGGAGNNLLTGGLGADTFMISGGIDRITDFQQGVDKLEAAHTASEAQAIINSATTTTVNGQLVTTLNSTYGLGGTIVLLGIDKTQLTVNDFGFQSATNNVNGTAGKDTLNGTSGNDSVEALGGKDTVFGNGGNDTVHGGAGDDVIYGNTGNDLLYGGLPTDHVQVGGGDVVYGGEGNDTIIGTGYVDWLSGNSGDDVIHGSTLSGPGNHAIIDGGTGNDTIVGSIGEDTITFGQGNDLIAGNGGDDIFRFADGMHAGSGVTTISDFNAGDAIDLRALGATGIGSGPNEITVQAGAHSAQDIYFDGQLIAHVASANSLTAGNFVFSQAPTDYVQMQGTPDDDIYNLTNINGRYFHSIGAGAVDSFTSHASYAIDGGAGNDFFGVGDGNFALSGGDGNDSFYGYRTDVIDPNNRVFIDGGAGNDYISMNAGQTGELHGGDGNDTVSGGGTGNDTLDGGAGNDIIGGYARTDSDSPNINSIDVSTGGAGDDLFLFNFQYVAGYGNDVITTNENIVTDFDVAHDSLAITSYRNIHGQAEANPINQAAITSVEFIQSQGQTSAHLTIQPISGGASFGITLVGVDQAEYAQVHWVSPFA